MKRLLYARPVNIWGIHEQWPQILLCPEKFVLTYNKNKNLAP